MGGWMGGWVGGWVGGWADRWADRWADGWVAGWVGGCGCGCVSVGAASRSARTAPCAYMVQHSTWRLSPGHNLHKLCVHRLCTVAPEQEQDAAVSSLASGPQEGRRGAAGAPSSPSRADSNRLCRPVELLRPALWRWIGDGGPGCGGRLDGWDTQVVKQLGCSSGCGDGMSLCVETRSDQCGARFVVRGSLCLRRQVVLGLSMGSMTCCVGTVEGAVTAVWVRRSHLALVNKQAGQ